MVGCRPGSQKPRQAESFDRLQVVCTQDFKIGPGLFYAGTRRKRIAFEDVLMHKLDFVARRRDANLPSLLLCFALQRKSARSKPREVRGIEIENVTGANDKPAVACGNDF